MISSSSLKQRYFPDQEEISFYLQSNVAVWFDHKNELVEQISQAFANTSKPDMALRSSITVQLNQYRTNYYLQPSEASALTETLILLLTNISSPTPFR